MEESREGRRETEKETKHWGWAVLLERELHLNKIEKENGEGERME